MREIGKAKRRPAEARAVIQIGIVIGCADGYFDDSERDVVREACSALDIPRPSSTSTAPCASPARTGPRTRSPRRPATGCPGGRTPVRDG
ncbi:hypothetical protein SVIO_020680 [Streptomyces violaceusniger]|uniref:Co-chaperone DjlA N-terminal domain-containing protein n=1 Tax=Streptomyces violaceusniger TaxID=68280 RepID=A0A4D4KR86_STRVO|nr:hypothetical protein SVIO_020680 [Streptomyces violaceusniger]